METTDEIRDDLMKGKRHRYIVDSNQEIEDILVLVNGVIEVDKCGPFKKLPEMIPCEECGDLFAHFNRGWKKCCVCTAKERRAKK